MFHFLIETLTTTTKTARSKSVFRKHFLGNFILFIHFY